MNLFFPLLLILVGVATASPKQAVEAPNRTKLKKYRIISTVGRVTAWEPFSTSWSDVKAGDELWESTLVQIHRGGTFSFELATKEALRGIQGDAIQVKLGTPIAVRLNEDIMRQIELGSYFIPNLPKSAARPEEAKNPVYQTISEAWNRLAAIAAVRGLPLEGMLPDLNNQESSLALRAKHMNLITPASGATVLVPKVPTDVLVSWDTVADENTTYELRMWRLDEPRPGPIALTQIDHHYLTVPREGPYFIQVATADGKYQSDPHQIFVSLPIAGRIEKDTMVSGLASLPIPLELPPNGFVYQAGTFPASITFEWDLNIDDEVQPTFKFTVTDMAGKPLVETNVPGRSFVARFGRPGKFKWNVSAVIPAMLGEKREKVITSVNYTFEIKGVSATNVDPIAEALFANKSQVVYLEGGFGK